MLQNKTNRREQSKAFMEQRKANADNTAVKRVKRCICVNLMTCMP